MRPIPGDLTAMEESDRIEEMPIDEYIRPYRLLLQSALEEGLLDSEDLEAIRTAGTRRFRDFFRVGKPDVRGIFQFQDGMDEICNKLHVNYRFLYKRLRVLLQDTLNSLIVETRIREREREAVGIDRAHPCRITRGGVKMVAVEAHGDVLWIMDNSESQNRIRRLDSGRGVEVFRGVPASTSRRVETP